MVDESERRSTIVFWPSRRPRLANRGTTIGEAISWSIWQSCRAAPTVRHCTRSRPSEKPLWEMMWRSVWWTIDYNELAAVPSRWDRNRLGFAIVSSGLHSFTLRCA